MASTMKQGAATADRIGAPDKVRAAGVLCAVGGASWLVNGLVFLVISQPDGAAFVIAEAVWIAIQTLLLIGMVGLALSGAAEIHSLVIGEESVLLPVGALLTAVGMTLVGIAVLRANRWTGWRRFTPLLAGVYPFVAMFPFIFITSEPNMIPIAIWGLPWLLLGYAIYSNARER